MLSRITYVLCSLLILYAAFIYYPRWKKPMTEATIAWDVAGYYWYLPSVFIYKDLKQQSFKDSILPKYYPTPDFQEAYIDPQSGNYVLKYTAGMAVLYLPFFTAAHLLAGPLGYPPDGFSPPYQLAIQLGGVWMSLLGLWLLRRFLKYYYEDKVVALVLLLLVFGSNYLNWAAIDAGLSHAWLFTIYTLLLLQTRRFHLQPSYSGAFRIGLLVGIAGLSRPTDLLSALIPLLWGLESLSRAAIRAKLAFLRQHLLKLLPAALALAMVLSVQLIYWKLVTGRWIVYTYGDQGFSFLHPHIREFTTNYSTGWLVYAPVMVFAIIGIIPFLARGANKVMVVTFSVLNCYIMASWDLWSYSIRAMIQSYPLLCLLLAAFIAAAFRRRWLLALSMPFFLLCIYHNFWFTYVAHPGTLWPGAREQRTGLWDGIDIPERYFWRVVGRWQMPSPELWKLRDMPYLFEGTPRDQQLLYRNDFETDTGYLVNAPINGKRSLEVSADRPVSPVYAFPLRDPSAAWVRAEAVFRCTNREWDVWSMGEWHLAAISQGDTVRHERVRVHRTLADWETKPLTFDLRLNGIRADSIAVWVAAGSGGKHLLLDDLQVWSFKE